MLAVKGIIQGNTVVIEDEDIKKYEGKDVIVTILDYPYKKQHKENKVDLRKYMGRGEKMFQSDAQEYVKELRDDERKISLRGRKERKMEEHAILSERLEDQLKAVEWAKMEQKRLLKEKGERLSKELMTKMTPFILKQ